MTPSNSHRYVGWPIFWFVAIAIIALQLIGYLFSEKTPESAADQIDQEARIALQLKATSDALSKLGGGQASKDSETSLKEVVSKLAQSRKTNLAAARQYTTLRHEMKQPADENDLNKLANSKDKKDQAIAAIYGTIPPGPNDVARFESLLKKPSFTEKLALVHARERAKVGATGREAVIDPKRGVAFAGIAMAAIGLSFIGFVGGMVFAAGRANGKFAPIGFSSASEPPDKLNPDWDVGAEPADAAPAKVGERFASSHAGRAGLGVLALFGGGAVAAVALDAIERALGVRFETSASGMVGFLLAIVLTVILIRTRIDGVRATFAQCGLTGKNFGTNVVWGIVGAGFELPLALLAGAIGIRLFSFLPAPSHPISLELASGPSPIAIIILGVTAVVLAPLFEETIFRGILLPALSTRTASGIGAFVLNGFLFAAIHPTGIPAWPALIVTGTVASILAYYRGSIVPCIIMHAIHNAILLGLGLTL